MELSKTVQTMFLVLSLTSVIFLTEHRVNADAISATLIVDAGGLGNFTSIQEAVNYANPGDTIFVRNGTYNENVVITNKPLSLIGEHSDSTIIAGYGNGSVVSIVTTSNASLSGFTITNSSTGFFEGIRIQSSDGVVVSRNKIQSNTYGIGLYTSYHNVISHNTLLYNSLSGIFFSSSGDNVIHGNTFSSNGLYGIDLSYSPNNTIYHNNFNETMEQVSSFSSGNFWDYNGEGNYWHDYDGQDANGDGLGDIPYNVPDENPDNHPLMGAFSIFDVTAAEGTYDVPVISNSTIPQMIFEIGAETRNRILRFNTTGSSGTFGFCRIALPNDLMQYPYTLLIGGEEAAHTFIGALNGANIIYFAYLHTNATIRVISSEVLRLYTDLLGNFSKLQMDFYGLNSSYYELLDNYSLLQENLLELNASYQQLYGLNSSYYELLDNYSTLQIGFDALNTSYIQLLGNYTTLQTSLNDVTSAYSGLSSIYSVLRSDFAVLNSSYHSLLSLHISILENYTQLQGSYNALSTSYSEQLQNLQSLMYIIVAITTAFIVTTVYLSMQIQKNKAAKRIVFEDEE